VLRLSLVGFFGRGDGLLDFLKTCFVAKPYFLAFTICKVFTEKLGCINIRAMGDIV